MSSFNSDFSYLRAPYEEFSSEFRTTKRKIEKELSFALSHLKTMRNNSANLDRQQALASLSGLHSRLSAFKEKLQDLYHQEDHWLSVFETRSASISGPNPHKTLKMIVEHYCRQDRLELAQKLLTSSSIEPLTELHFFQKSKTIRDDLGRKDLTSALEWCDAHKSRLKKLKSPLEFNLKLQRFIEFVRAQNLYGAIVYARGQLSKYPEHQEEIQKAMMLLLVANKPSEFLQYQELLNEENWVRLVRLFHEEMLKVYSLSTESSIGIVLRAGFIALKNPMCESENKVQGCPMCNTNIQTLSKRFPYACHSHTSIICRVLNVVMDEFNPPVALPNGQIYSEQGIQKLIVDQKIVCPATGAIFSLKQVSKLYIV